MTDDLTQSYSEQTSNIQNTEQIAQSDQRQKQKPVKIEKPQYKSLLNLREAVKKPELPNYSSSYINLLSPFPIYPQQYTAFWYNEEDQTLHTIDDQFSSEITLDQFVSKVVGLLNEEFIRVNYSFKLNYYPGAFDVYIAKKRTGRPDLDFPQFELRCKLGETNQIKFAIKAHTQDVVTNIFEQEKKITTKLISEKKLIQDPPVSRLFKLFSICCTTDQ